MIDMRKLHPMSEQWRVYFSVSSNGEREYKYEPTHGWEHSFVGNESEVKAYIASLPKK